MTTRATGGALLLVEDDDSIGKLVKQYLEQQDGWRVLWRRTGEEAIAELRGQPVRLVVLDIGLPGMDGFEVCRRIRAGSKVPIVMLTARDEEPDRVAGLELGADDYVSKPFSPRELSARIKAILRRSERRTEDEVLAAREIVLRRDSHEVTVAGAQVELTSKEFDLLALLPRASGHRPLAREAARSRLGHDVSRRHPHRRRARRAAAAQARRPGGDPHGARRRLQARPGLRCAAASLRSRLFRAIGVVVLICVAFTIGVGLVLTHRAVKRATLKDLAHQADLIAATRGDSAARTLPSCRRLSSGSTSSFSRPADPAGLRRRSGSRTGKGRCRDDGSTADYFAARKLNPGTLILLRPESTASSLLSPYVWGLLIAAAAGGLLAALAAFLLARRISRPVDRIAAAARTLARGTHPEPVPVEGATEIATLAGAFNELATQLQQAQEAERNFLLSVSHELKTPLTAIRATPRRSRTARSTRGRLPRPSPPRRGGSSGSSRTCSTSRG